MRSHTAPIALFLALAAVSPATFATTYCVDSQLALENALADAADNSSDDEIRIRTGLYYAVGYFSYHPPASRTDDLRISGGWGPACLRYSARAHLTVLDGGGAFGPVLDLVTSGGQITVSNLEIRGAFSGTSGEGALHIDHSFGVGPAVTIERVIFRDNQAYAALYVATGQEIRLLGSLFHSNVAVASGAAAYLVQEAAGVTRVLANTFANNERTLAGGIGGLRFDNVAQTPYCSMVDNIFWGNEFLDVEIHGFVNDFSFNDYGVRYGSSFGFSNLQVDPEFESPGDLDFRLGMGSPMVDSGTNGAPNLPSYDLAGTPRPQTGTYDRGAFERRPVIFVDGFESGDTGAWSAALP